MSSLLSGIRFGAAHASDSDDDDRKKKKKKDPKKKDSKSHKKKKKSKDKASDSNDDDDVPPPTAAAAAPPAPSIQRDEWMNMDFMGGPPRPVQHTADEQRKIDLEKTKQSEIEQGLREPNSGLLYGLYDPKTSASAQQGMNASSSSTEPLSTGPSSSLGDGGASWKYKMLVRARQRAAESGESVEAIVRAQYGMSLAELEAQAQASGDANSHLRYKRLPPSTKPPVASPSSSSAGDKKLISEYTSRMKYSSLAKETSGGKDGQDNDDDGDDGGPIDYSKLPDDDDNDRRRRHHHQRDRSAPRRGRSSDRRGACTTDRRPDDRRTNDRRHDDRRRRDDTHDRQARDKAKAAAAMLTDAEKEEAARRAAFLYRAPTTSSSTSDRASPPSQPTQVAPVPLPSTSSHPSMPSANEPVDLNKLAAQALRAKMRGNLALFDTLTKQLNQLEHVQVTAKATRGATKPTRAMVRARDTLPERPEDALHGTKRGKRSSAGDDASLDDLVREEKSGQVPDMDAVFMKNVVRLGARYEGSDLAQKKGASGFDEEDDVNMKMHTGAKARLTERAFAEKNERAMLSDRLNWDKAMQRCWHCPGSDAFKGHLVVAMGQHAYVALAAASTVVDLQCLIVPTEHVAAMTSMDESVDAEVAAFKAALEAMAQSQEQSMVFMERTFDAAKKRHTVIECVALPRETAADVPLFFKQAILECDEEWSTHKKIIDTSGKGVKRAIPKNFAYFHVEWPIQNNGAPPTYGGYGHIIEDAAQFPADFGMDTIAGMLEVDPPRYGRYHPSLAAENERVRRFVELWTPFAPSSEVS
ncbi:Aste57867_10948 [Aphanomyces stellatus]|uniref:Aste57867_10948 protein n=1 Tax=Aphanomyces stellatus TaxID=120398 RepID=A0A485KS80_9STRA|nr:hypothetical protein As57867_010908 [Aphanomyces stellatus]VFT87816.1 Aste57867_10948 [Aphanomyces stellatus]